MGYLRKSYQNSRVDNFQTAILNAAIYQRLQMKQK